MKREHVAQALVVPGFGGSKTSGLVVSLLKALEQARISSEGVTLARRAPRAGLAHEVEQLQQTATSFFKKRALPRFLVGRSFGGRVGVFWALQQPVSALVLLGYPIRPPGKQRKLDEQAFLSLKCPTLVIQGEVDELGPLKVLSPLVKKNPHVELRLLPKTAHAFGKHESLAIDWTVEFLSAHCNKRQG